MTKKKIFNIAIVGLGNIGTYLYNFLKKNKNLINNKNNNTFKNNADLNQIFKEVIDIEDNNIVFSCGSGVTASVLALASSLINNKYTPTIYDGSWSEYGLIK